MKKSACNTMATGELDCLSEISNYRLVFMASRNSELLRVLLSRS